MKNRFQAFAFKCNLYRYTAVSEVMTDFEQDPHTLVSVTPDTSVLAAMVGWVGYRLLSFLAFLASFVISHRHTLFTTLLLCVKTHPIDDSQYAHVTNLSPGSNNHIPIDDSRHGPCNQSDIPGGVSATLRDGDHDGAAHPPHPVHLPRRAQRQPRGQDGRHGVHRRRRQGRACTR